MLNLREISKRADKLIKKITKKDFKKWVLFDEKRAKNLSSNPVLADSVAICKHEGCKLPASCNGKCGGHCDCLAG